eukprot:TRINITY_DN140_c0_g1_i14.p1 TRINITY_DN140_c0_g1~~TRINITY_DN140_c0_g1_i14.p1  ORF type:complete len:143 (-),score=74.10 TRINITY_DN140_c0_g1_i14:66-494(-)
MCIRDSLKEGHGGDLGDHGNGGTLENGDTAEALAALVGVDDEGASGLEDKLAHVTLLDELGVLDLLASGGLLSGLPHDLLEAEGALGGAAVCDGAVSDLDLTGVVEDHRPVSYTHLRAHETVLDLVCRLLLEKKKKKKIQTK